MIIQTEDTIKADGGLHKTTLPGIYELIQPENPAPLIFDSPHSGDQNPDDFNYTCSDKDIESTRDHFVDELFADAPTLGASLLAAQFPRAYLDLNRKMDDICPDLYAGAWPTGKEGYIKPNPTNRSYAGIGLIRRLIKPNISVYNAKLSPTEIQARIDNYYKPYYGVLGAVLDNEYLEKGRVYHINCHSMPSSSVRNDRSTRFNPAKQVDFVLGNRDGTTCDKEFTDTVKNKLMDMGYNVAINSPYKGVELVERFSNPAKNRHSLQIEINKALYMNERKAEKSKDFEKLKGDLNQLIEHLVDYTQSS